MEVGLDTDLEVEIDPGPVAYAGLLADHKSSEADSLGAFAASEVVGSIRFVAQNLRAFAQIGQAT
jgi:hypothetical protein